MDVGETLYVTSASEWRAWLESNHDIAREIWLVLYNKDTGKASLPYNDAVEQALCFGWIDSTMKRHGDGRAQRYSPRRPGSGLSEMNRVRMQRLIDSGQMTQAGLDAVGDQLYAPFELAADIEAALKAVPEAWQHFQSFTDGYRRIRAGFVEAARNRPELFEKRLAYLVKMSAQNKRFGMVQ